jgi:serine/threonine protein kinase
MLQPIIYICRGYIAPEMIEKGEISFKSDIFSLGVIFINLLTRSDNNGDDNVRGTSLTSFVMFLLNYVIFCHSVHIIVTTCTHNFVFVMTCISKWFFS